MEPELRVTKEGPCPCVSSPGSQRDSGTDPKPEHVLPFCKWYWGAQVHACTIVGTFDPDSGGGPGEPQQSQHSDGPGSLRGRDAPCVSVLLIVPFLSCLLFPVSGVSFGHLMTL